MNIHAVVKVVLWSRGAHLTKPGWSKPHTHSIPTNLALFRHKIALYRFNQGGSYYCRGAQMGAGGRLSPPPHFNHCIHGVSLLSDSCKYLWFLFSGTRRWSFTARRHQNAFGGGAVLDRRGRISRLSVPADHLVGWGEDTPVVPFLQMSSEPSTHRPQHSCVYSPDVGMRAACYLLVEFQTEVFIEPKLCNYL